MRMMWSVVFAMALSLPVMAAEAPTADAVEHETEGTEITVNESREHGRFLADANGRALYLLEEDPEGESTCYDACERVWPPLLTVDGEPVAAESMVDEDRLDTIKREDGFSQVTYNGKPLYYYAQDEGEQQATGHHVTDAWGEWYLVTPEGEPLHDEENDNTP